MSADSQCFHNPPVPTPACGSGVVHDLAGLKAYISGPADSNRAVLLVSDIFGYEAPNLRQLADKVATQGFLVVVPDLFYGDPVTPEMREMPGFDIQVWKANHGHDKGCEDVNSIIAALRTRGASSFGVVGFCWGGVLAVKMAASDAIQAAVSIHPGPISDNQINDVKVPLAILGAEVDHSCSAEKLKQFREIFSTKLGIDSFVKIFPGVSHGFAVRYSLEDESAVKSAEEAHSDMLNWVTKYVK